MEQNIITSRQNPIVKDVCGLAEKKKREASGLFRFDGIKLFLEAIDKHAPIRYVFVNECAPDSVKRAVEESKTDASVYILSDAVFSKLTDEISPEGIITVCSELENIEKKQGCYQGEGDEYGVGATESLLLVSLDITLEHFLSL